MLISDSLMPSLKNAPKKVKRKNSQNPPAAFFGYSFFRGIFYVGIKEFEISIKFCVFLYPH
jgi:hypothetical protein